MINKDKEYFDFFNHYFNEDEVPNQDPNAMVNDGTAQGGMEGDAEGMEQPMEDGSMMPQDPMAQSSVLLPDDDNEDEEDEFEKLYPMEKDGGNPEQDINNFANFQKLQYFNKFKDLSKFIDNFEKSLNQAKVNVNLDEVEDEKQHKIINLLVNSLIEVKSQIKFFLDKGIVSVNIDKTRSIYRSEIKKLNMLLTEYEKITRDIEVK